MSERETLAEQLRTERLLLMRGTPVSSSTFRLLERAAEMIETSHPPKEMNR